MAIYHFSAKVIQRSRGRSAVAAAAYRSASELEDERVGRSYDYTAKQGVVHSEIMLSDGAPTRWQDRSALWNEVEAIERRKDAVLAREVEFALPRELSQAEGIALAQAFVREQFVTRGMVADLNVHWTRAAHDELQPHAHVMLSMREVDGDGFGKKQRGWNDVGLLREWRERWAELANERLAQLGHDVQVDHRSLREQGIDLEPQNKIGPVGTHRQDERRRRLERTAEHREIARRNGERIIAEPAIALDALTRQHSTFTRHELARFVDRHTDGAEQFASVLAVVEASPKLVRLGEDGRGRTRFSTREMLEVERGMERAAEAMAGRDGHRVSQMAGTRAVKAAERDRLALGEEQRAAFRHVTSGADLALVVGYAGTGKSAMLGVARTAWEAEGYRVRGATLSGIAAEGLEAGSGIASRTIASLEFAWKEGRELLGSRDVLVVDEAGLVGSRQMERVLSAAQAAGAKVVLVGDPEQLQAIEAGAAFRALAEWHGAAEITTVRRQREGWQREATRELATERTGEALGRYAAAGMVQGAETREAARAALVVGWDAVREQSPQASQVMLAYTRDDVRALNELGRARLRASGALRTPDQVVQTERGERAFAAGERIMFQRNERGLGGDGQGRGGAAVKNGTLGTVLAIDAGEGRLTVRLDGAGGSGGKGAGRDGKDGSGAVVTFSLRDYAHLDHGYAATVHKAQGVTVDRAHLLATPHLDRHAAYVGLTRHRDGVALHYAREDFGDPAALARMLGRERAKDTSLDYPTSLPARPGQLGQERDGAALARRYAERRGLDLLHPESEIVVRASVQQREAEARAAEPGRDRFAGLRLGMPRDVAGRALEIAAQAGQGEPAPSKARQAQTEDERLSRALAGYARAWSDAARMERQGLPVLPHQEQALERAGRRLEAHEAGLSRDAQAALEAKPSLADGIGQPGGMVAFGRAIGEERAVRLEEDRIGREAVRAWTRLEQAYGKAVREHDWEGQRRLAAGMEQSALALKANPALDDLLRERGKEFGIAEGSRLDRLVQGEAQAATRELRRELGLGQGRGMSMGR